MKLTLAGLRHLLKPQTGAGGAPRATLLLAALYLAPLALIFNLAGCLPPYLRLLLTYLLLLLPLCLRPGRRPAWGGLVVVGVMLVEAWVVPPPVADLALLLLAHQAVWHAVGPVPARLSAGVVGYAFLHLFLFLSPLGYSSAEGLAAGTGRLAGWVTGSAYNLGPTYQGLGGLLLFLCLSIAGWDRSRLGFWRTASYLGVALLVNGVLALVLIRKVDFAADMVWELKYQERFGFAQLWQHVKGLALLAYPGLIFLVQMAVYLVLHHDAGRRGAAGQANGAVKGWLGLVRPGPRWIWAPVACAALLACLAMPPTAWREPRPMKVICVEKGVVSYTKPDYTRYGRAAGGMFGLLPEYARLFGCATELVKEIPAELAGDEVLVLTNIDSPTPPEEMERLWAFVRNGGRLWVLGDHTFIKNGRNHINDLLQPCHIAFEHDSAQFFPQGWFNSYDFRQGTPFGELRDPAENRPAILVGASLLLEAPAVPFVLGRHGYGDYGTTASDEQRGYIGDFEYQAQERLGDLVLVAGEKVGKGKVLVFGDTTSFFCNNMPRSYEILRAGLSWLGESPGWSALNGTGGKWLVAALAVAFLPALLWWATPAGVAGALGIAALLALLGHRPTGAVAFDQDFSRSRLAIVDFSHQPDASKHGSMDEGLHGLTINMMRYGLLPVAADRWDRELLEAARVIVMNAPRKVIAGTEREELEAFMERGGTVILACGFPHYEFAEPLLRPHQIKVRGLPLGRFFDRPMFGHRVSFFSAWPLETLNSELSVVCMYDQWPLVARLPVGKGQLVVIGDSEMLQNRNVEGFENYDPASIQFIRSLLDYTVGPPGS